MWFSHFSGIFFSNLCVRILHGLTAHEDEQKRIKNQMKINVEIFLKTFFITPKKSSDLMAVENENNLFYFVIIVLHQRPLKKSVNLCAIKLNTDHGDGWQNVLRVRKYKRAKGRKKDEEKQTRQTPIQVWTLIKNFQSVPSLLLLLLLACSVAKLLYRV